MADVQLFEDNLTEFVQAQIIPVGTLVEHLETVMMVFQTGILSTQPDDVPLLSLASGDIHTVTPTTELRILRETERVTLRNVE